jgi:hypothetical protein
MILQVVQACRRPGPAHAGAERAGACDTAAVAATGELAIGGCCVCFVRGKTGLARRAIAARPARRFRRGEGVVADATVAGVAGANEPRAARPPRRSALGKAVDGLGEKPDVLLVNATVLVPESQFDSASPVSVLESRALGDSFRAGEIDRVAAVAARASGTRRADPRAADPEIATGCYAASSYS